jgi:hypothetical protein
MEETEKWSGLGEGGRSGREVDGEKGRQTEVGAGRERTGKVE